MAIEADPYLSRAVITQAAPGNLEVVAAVAGQHIKLVGFFMGLDTDGTFHWESAATDLTGIIPLMANAPCGYRGSAEEPLLKTAAGEALNLETTGGSAEGIALYYVEGD